MAGNFNKTILVGNLTRNPDIRYIASGAAVTKITLAVNRSKKNNKTETDFIDCVFWDKLAETCNTYLKKGMSCLVEGRLAIRPYIDKDGNKRKATEIVCSRMVLLEKAPANAANIAPPDADGDSDDGAPEYDAEDFHDDGDPIP